MKVKVKAKNLEKGTFKAAKIPESARKSQNDIDLNQLYERAINELGLQQSKRDQLLTIYLAMFSFLIPFALSLEVISWQVKGFIFLATAVVGMLFADIIVRYRVYKEVYWLCCQTITMLFGIKNDRLTKPIIQQCYRRAMYKKGKKYLYEKDTDKKDKDNNPIIKLGFSKLRYIKDNLTSSEFVYFVIHSFITVLVFGLSIGLILEFTLTVNIIIAVICSLILFIIFMVDFFSRCIKIYKALADNDPKSFNYAFSKAWFLHFYIDDND